MQVRLSRRALVDLHSIQSYIRQEAPRAADKVGESLLASCRSLGHFPHRGRRGLAPGTRELVTSLYVIVYDVHSTYVEILRVYHGRQDR